MSRCACVKDYQVGLFPLSLYSAKAQGLCLGDEDIPVLREALDTPTQVFPGGALPCGSCSPTSRSYKKRLRFSREYLRKGIHGSREQSRVFLLSPSAWGRRPRENHSESRCVCLPEEAATSHPSASGTLAVHKLTTRYCYLKQRRKGSGRIWKAALRVWGYGQGERH